MTPDTLSLGTVTFGALVGVASSAFTAGTVYAAILSRLKRTEERQDKFEAEFSAYKAQREILTQQWREETRQHDRDLIALQTEVRHISDTVAAIADKVGAVPR